MADKTKAVAKADDKPDFALSLKTSELQLIKNNIAPESTKDEFNLFIYDSQMRGLNPLKKEIYFVKRAGKATHQISIDGSRIIAQRTGGYEGQTPVVFSEDEIETNGISVPEWAEAGVYRKGFREPVVARAYFNEYKQEFKGQLGTMWKKMPRHMLSKCAESLALRKAFPDTLAGLYTNEEMQIADLEVKSAEGAEVNQVEPETGEIIEPDVQEEKPKKKEKVQKSFEDMPNTPEF